GGAEAVKQARGANGRVPAELGEVIRSGRYPLGIVAVRLDRRPLRGRRCFPPGTCQSRDDRGNRDETYPAEDRCGRWYVGGWVGLTPMMPMTPTPPARDHTPGNAYSFLLSGGRSGQWPRCDVWYGRGGRDDDIAGYGRLGWCGNLRDGLLNGLFLPLL